MICDFIFHVGINSFITDRQFLGLLDAPGKFSLFWYCILSMPHPLLREQTCAARGRGGTAFNRKYCDAPKLGVINTSHVRM